MMAVGSIFEGGFGADGAVDVRFDVVRAEVETRFDVSAISL